MDGGGKGQQPFCRYAGDHLVPGFWGKGYATELANAGLDYFWKYSDRNEIYAITEVPNIASQKVLLKAGFHLLLKREHEGKPIIVYIAKRKGSSTSAK